MNERQAQIFGGAVWGGVNLALVGVGTAMLLPSLFSSPVLAGAASGVSGGAGGGQGMDVFGDELSVTARDGKPGGYYWDESMNRHPEHPLPQDPSSDGYATADDAAIAALKATANRTIRTDWEWGGLIFYNPFTNKYGFTEPYTNKDRLNVRMGVLPPNMKYGGSYHSHPTDRYHGGNIDEIFQSDDWSYDDSKGTSTYLITRNLCILYHHANKLKAYFAGCF